MTVKYREKQLEDMLYMNRAIELAKRGEGWVHPNPLVGAVIVKDGEVIGEGWHERYGELHAERNAIASIPDIAASEGKDPTKVNAEGATIYVTLEPCCHYGKTPPCTEAIIENKISRVVIGSRDPNPKVSGGGVKILRDAGIEVVEDFMREECDKLNDVFFHYITTKKPYTVLKYAMTADGKIATKTGASRWITSEEARKKVHEMRNAYMGIMVGIGTVLADDPMLNCRIEGGRSPLRIVCDSKLRTPADSNLCKTADTYETMIATAVLEDAASEEELADYRNKCEEMKKLGVGVINVPGADGRVDLNALMEALGHVNVDSVLIEGGSGLAESAFKAGIIDEVKAFIAPKIFGGSAKTPVEGEGVSVPDEAFLLEMKEVEQIGQDLLISYRVKKQ